MGVQPIRGVGMVRLRLRVSGARANHLCGRAEESRADTRACCERGVRALSTQRRLAAVVIQRTTAHIAPGVQQNLRRPRNATRARARRALPARCADHAWRCSRATDLAPSPSDPVFGACSATRPTWPRLPPGRIFPRPWAAPRANRFANTSTAPYVLGSQTGGSSWDGSCALISRETSS